MSAEPWDDTKIIANLGYLAETDEQRAMEAEQGSVKEGAALERAFILRTAQKRLIELTKEKAS